MADRTVTVSLVASVNGYISGMQRAAAETRTLGSEAQRVGQQSEAMKSIGVVALAAGAAVGLGLGAAVKAAADFDAQMAQVQTLSHATAGEMGSLREAALNLGQGIGFSATQVADAETELVKAGVSVKDQLGGALVGALNLAAAGQLDVADATEIAASAMTQFKLKGKDVPHIADLLAAGADKALGSVQDLGEALKYVGPVSQSLGVSIEQTTGTLALFAQNGILGEQAGTSLRGVLLSLTAPSQAASKVMQEYGINLFNAKGEFIGVNGAAQQLKDKLSPLDQATRTAALGQIFGNQQITAANVLYEGGAKSVDKWTKAVDDNGFASEQASGKMNSLNGDLSKLKAAFESGLIETGESASVALRGVVQGVTGVVEAFNNMSDTGKTVVFVVGSVASAALLMGGGFLTVIPKIAATRAALETLSASGLTARGALASAATFLTGPWGIALAAASVTAAVFIGNQLEAAKRTAQLRQTLDETTGALTKTSRAFIAQNLQTKSFFGFGHSAFDDADKLGIALDKVTKAAQGNASAFKELKAKQKELHEAAGFGNVDAIQQSDAIDRIIDRVNEQRESVKQAKEQIGQLNEAQKGSAEASDTNADAVSGVAQASSDAADAVSELADKLKGLTSNQLDVNSTQRDFEAAIDGVTDSIKDNGTSLDVTSDAGRKNSATLDQIAQSALSYSAALYQQTGDQGTATAALEQGRSSLIAALGQYGITGQAAEDYADKILGTPTQWATTFNNNANAAGGPVDGLKSKILSIPTAYNSKINVDVSGAVNVDATTNAVNRLKAAIQQAASVGASTPIVAHAGSGNVAFADGGAVYGPGSGTSDSVNARLSNGEHVLTARDVSLLGGQAGVYAFRASLASGVRKFAEGGAVTPTYVPAPPQVVYADRAPSTGRTLNQTNHLYSLDPEPFAQAVIRRENLGFV